MFKTELFRTTRRFLFLGILSLGLWFLAFDRSVVNVKADDCYDAYTYFSTCEYYCQVQYDGCVANHQAGCGDALRLCLQDCGTAHLNYGTTCSLPSHTPMVDVNAACEANAQRVMDNCVAGTLGTLWNGKYLDCMVDAGSEGTMYSCCETLRDEYLNQGCY